MNSNNVFSSILAVVLAIAIAALAIFAIPFIGLLVGAFAGWAVGLVFPGTVGLVGTIITSGLTIPAWQVGAILGFVGGFFKTRLINKSE